MMGKGGDLCGRPAMLPRGKPLAGGVIVAVVQFYAGPVAPELLGCRKGRTATAEWVQDKVAPAA